MKKWKFLTAIAIVILMAGLLGFTVYATFRSTGGVANRTDFLSGDENVFVEISAKYEGPLPDDATSVPDYHYVLDKNKANAFETTPLAIPHWTIGQTNFSHEHTTMAFVYTIKNLNETNKLNVTISEIAADYRQRFETVVYVYDEGQTPSADNSTLLKPSAPNIKVLTAPTVTINPESTTIIRVEFTIKSFASSFEGEDAFKNNMSILFETAYEN